MNENPDLFGRRILRSNWERLDRSDQDSGVPCPDAQKAFRSEAGVVSLPDVNPGDFQGTDLVRALWKRRSCRTYTGASLSLQELSFLLFATQGVHSSGPKFSKRPSPSAGARHPFETYISAFSITGLAPGLYRFLPFDHALCLIREGDDLRGAAETALLGQGWGAPVIFYWTAVPYRTEWRYQGASHKLIALDAGHLCQNLYLACEASGAGTCSIGAYDQASCDQFLGVDGIDELTVYAAPVGKVGGSD